MFCCESAEKAKNVIAKDNVTEKMSEFFKAFSEPIRIKLLLAMLHGEICVKDLAELLEVSQPRVSNQLRFLKENNLVKYRKEKNHIYYSLDDDHIKEILTIGLKHMSHIHNL